MHLTNYAINKESDTFEQNRDANKADTGHKRSLSFVLDYFDKHSSEENSMPTGDQLWQQIKEICVKTIMCGIHQIEHVYKSSKPNDLENSLCFQIFGMDIFIDSESKPWLLEVNHTPSFCTDSPLDYNIKKNVLRDTLHILNLNQKRKAKYLVQIKNEKEKRLVGGDTKRKTTKEKQIEKELLKQKNTMIKDKFENSNMGDFQNLFPLPKGVSQDQDKV